MGNSKKYPRCKNEGLKETALKRITQEQPSIKAKLLISDTKAFNKKIKKIKKLKSLLSKEIKSLKNYIEIKI